MSTLTEQSQRRHPRQPQPALPGLEVFGGARDHQRRLERQASSSRPAASSRPRARRGREPHARRDRTRSRRRPRASTSPSPSDLRILERRRTRGPSSRAAASPTSPIPARLGWQPTKDGLRLAWQVTIDDPRPAQSCWNATVDAETGTLLDVDRLDEPGQSSSDLASTLARSVRRSFRFRRLVTPRAGSANPRERRLELSRARASRPRARTTGRAVSVENPADATRSPFGWHDTNGVAGAEFTITRGNNAHAYLDQDDDESQDFGNAPNGGAGLDFDFPADLTRARAGVPRRVVTNLFYGCNTFHDILYRYGFDEAADNFQADQLRRRRRSRTATTCAARGRRTARARTTPTSSTPAQGGTPRMQMFLWPGNQLGSQNQVVVSGVGELRRRLGAVRPAGHERRRRAARSCS